MNSKPDFCLVHWTFGWSLEGIDHPSVPTNAVQLAVKVLPPGAVMALGVAHHLAFTSRPLTVLAFATPENLARWEAQIADSLSKLSPEQQWLFGTDVGQSSGVIFHTLAKYGSLRDQAGCYVRDGNAPTPLDAGDFGRCLRLVEKFSGWEGRLGEVAGAFPNSKWPEIIARWHELKAATPETQSQILQEIDEHSAKAE